MPFLNQMIKNGSICTPLNEGNGQKLHSLLTGITKKQHIQVVKSWIFDWNTHINSLLNNAQTSWMIGSNELSSYVKGRPKRFH